MLDITKQMCALWEPELDDELAPEPLLCQHDITDCIICAIFDK